MGNAAKAAAEVLTCSRASTRRWPILRSVLLSGLVVVVVGPLLQACAGDGRSVEAFCSTYREEKEKFQDTYSGIGSNSDDPDQVLTDLMLGIQSLGDVSVILDKLDKVAPEDIEPDVAAVKKSWDDMTAGMGDQASQALNPGGLLGGMLKGLILGAQSNGSWTRVGQYITDHCES